MNLERVLIRIEALALALMAGGMLAFGAFVAPAVFHNLPLVEAGPLMTGLFRRFDGVLGVATILVILAEVIRLVRQGLPQALGAKIRIGLLAILVVLMSASLGWIHPQIEAYQKAGVMRGVGPQGQDFDRLHHQSESVYKAQFAVAAGVLVLLF